MLYNMKKNNGENNTEKNTEKNNDENILMNEFKIIKVMMKTQRKNILESKRLNVSDMRRIYKNITSDLFDEKKCCLWNGYITNYQKKNKGTYINFYFKKKKVALHRLLYYNFVDDLSDTEYLKFLCDNKGVCCNIHHMQKFKYNLDVTKEQQDETIVEESCKDLGVSFN